MNKKLISYVFPIYNEEESINKLYEEISSLFNTNKDKYDFEAICINDGSRDRSIELLTEIHNKDNRFKIVNFSRNFGHQMAITAGLDFSKGDAVIIMDADLQDPPSVSLELIKKWEEGYEVIYAQRKTRQDTPFKKISASIFYKLLHSLAEIDIPKDTGDFRLLDKKVVEVVKLFRERNRFNRGITAYVGFKSIGILFDRGERFAGETKYPLAKMIKLAFDGITSFSTYPLKLISQLGFAISLLSFLGIIYTLFIRIFYPSWAVPGWSFIVIATLFIGGVQLLMMGILGTYIGRIYSEVQNRPLYIVSSIFN